LNLIILADQSKCKLLMIFTVKVTTKKDLYNYKKFVKSYIK